MPAALQTLKHDSGDIKTLWSQGIYRHLLLYIVDNTGRHHIDFRGETLINDLSFFSYWRLNEKGKRQKSVYRLVTAPQGGTQNYTLAFAYDSTR